MAMFSSSNESERSTDAGSRGAAREANLSIIAVGMRVIGELITNGVVKVEGAIEGSVRADRQVLIAKGGMVEGDVYTREAIVGGQVKGSVFAEERVEVQAKSRVEGDIITQRLIVHEGGEVNGSVQMGDPKTLKQAAAEARGQKHREIARTGSRELSPQPLSGITSVET